MNDRKHVFHLIKSLGRGGAETLLTQTLREADRDSFRFSYGYYLPQKDALAAELRRLGAEVHELTATHRAGIVLSAPRLASLLRREAVDLLHCHLPLAGLAGRFSGRLAGIPVVYTEHNLQERYHPLTRFANRATWRLQSRVVAVSEAVRSSIVRRMPRSVALEVVHNGIPPASFEPGSTDGRSLRRRLGIPADSMVVGQVAVFRRQKRLDLWLEVAGRIHSRNPSCHFLLVGDGPEDDRLRRMCESFELAGVTHFTGLLDDVRPALAAMDVLLMSSEFEGLPLALLEAMAMEVPVVTTAVGGIPEVVVDGETGLLVEPAHRDALLDAVLSLLADDGKRARFGRAARERVERHFSTAAMQARLEELYREVLES